MGSGAVFTAVNPSYTVNELLHHFHMTKPRLLIVEPKLLHNTLIAAAEFGLSKENIFVFDIHSRESCNGLHSWEELLRHGESDWVQVPDPSKAIAQYASTSGTSGLPKVARLSHSYHVSQAVLRLSEENLPYEVRRLTALPPFHVFATPILPSSIRERHPTYVMPRFEMNTFLQHIGKFHITETYLPPPVIVAMPQTPQCTREKIRSLRQIWFGGASLKYKNQVPLYKLLHEDAKIQPVWGMTEAGWITAGKWHETIQDDSVGKPLSGFNVKVVGEDGEQITDEGVVGDVLVKSSALMLGYVDNEAATTEAFDNNGWLRTGDIGHVRDGDKVYIVDRKKDLIKVRGWQVSPAEVENIIIQHPQVEDAAVIGIDMADHTGELPRAYIVLQPGQQLDSHELRRWTGERLSKYKIPEQIVFVKSIPKNPTGKILRRVLRDQPIIMNEDKSGIDETRSCRPEHLVSRDDANAGSGGTILIIVLFVVYLWYWNSVKWSSG